VRRVISSYNRLGLAAIETPGKGGRRHEYISLEQERRFLQPFFARAAQGEIATAEEIQRAFEAEVKHAVHITSIYRLLDRHGWRTLVPRPRHPKANPEEQAAFKKTLRRRFKRDFPHAILTTDDQCYRWPKMKAALVVPASPDVPGLRLECGLMRHIRSCANRPTSMRQ
jgi:transposase